ncbi:MAG TPA: leucyl aminopeptidase family protein, partial [Fusibacter sp.]|nr:leucyl aminopeptidase family protein [Fusibacter sp.]
MIIDLKQSINMDEVDGLIVCLGKDTPVPDYLSVPVKQLKENETFESKIGQMQPLSLVYEGKYHEIALIGIGDGDSFAPTKYRKSLAEAFKALKAKKVKKIAVEASAVAACTSIDKKLARMMGETFIMSDYEFNDYKTDAKPSTVTEVSVSGLELDRDSFEEGKILGETNVFSRYLTNMPANVMTPEKLAELAKTYCEASNIEVEIFEEDAIEAMGMQAYLAVAKASSNPPRLIVMRHKGDPDSDKTVAFVGKGLTYDSGGLSIKPTASMVTMKDDMGGASAVISAMGAIGKLNLKVNVTAVVAACENMISGMSYKPGDIIGSMGGKSIYIGNTDAEGRLTLVDAVTYALERENANFVLDIATLTGAAIHCLGSEAAPVISNND